MIVDSGTLSWRTRSNVFSNSLENAIHIVSIECVGWGKNPFPVSRKPAREGAGWAEILLPNAWIFKNLCRSFVQKNTENTFSSAD